MLGGTALLSAPMPRDWNPRKASATRLVFAFGLVPSFVPHLQEFVRCCADRLEMDVDVHASWEQDGEEYVGRDEFVPLVWSIL